MIINVTERDILNGRSGHCYLCPVAKAAYRKLGNVTVTTKNIYQRDGKGHLIAVFPLPNEVTDFINAFDEGKKVVPFKFKIEDPKQ